MAVRFLLRSLLALALGAIVPPVAWAQDSLPPTPLTAQSTDCSTASSCVELPTNANGVTVVLSPTSGTFQAEFEVTGNGGRLWSAVTLFPTNSTTGVTNATAAGTWRGGLGGRFRIRLSTCSSCSVLVTFTPLQISPTSSGGGGGGGASEGSTGSSVPSSASYQGVNVAGNLRGETGIAAGSHYAQTVAIVDSSGNQISSFGGSGGTAMADDAAFTIATTTVTPIGALLDNTGTDSVDENDVGAVRMSANRNLFVNIRDNAGNERGLNIDASGQLAVTLASAQTLSTVTTVGTVTTLTQFGGTNIVTGGTNGALGIGGIQAADAAISGNNPVLVAGFGSSTLPSAMSANGDVTRPWLTLNGVANTTIRDANGDAAVDATLDAVKVTNSTAATATAYLTVRLSDGSSFLTPSSDVVEDAPETAGGSGPFVQSVRRDAAASSASTTGDNASFNTDANGLLWSRQMDPCTGVARTTIPVSVAADTAVITASASNRNYICGGALVAAAAEIVNVWEGTGTACGTSSAAVIGSTTEANGMSFAANGGFTIPTTIRGLSTNVDTCIRLSGTNRVAGWLTYVQAP